MKITTVWIDLAKNVLSMHGIDEHGNAVLRRMVQIKGSAQADPLVSP